MRRISLAILAAASRLRVLNSTVSGNTATDCCGGGLCLHKRRTLIVGSIVAGNSSGGVGPDCVSSSDPSLSSGGFNLFGDTSDCTIRGRSSLDIVGADPILGVLADNDGPTKTHAVLAGSPAIDMGTPKIGKALLLCTPFDQRGFPRNGRCDIGAYEF